MEMATKEEMDSLKKSVNDVVELVKKNQQSMTDSITSMVKDALANHPGYTPGRKVQFQGHTTSMGMLKDAREQSILKQMPKEVISEIDEIFLLSQIMKCKPNQLKSWEAVKYDMGDFKKALDTSTAGGTSEWVPTRFSDQFFEFVRLETKVRSLFPVIPMPGNPYDLPIGIGRMTSFKVTEQTADTGQDKVTVGDTSNLSNKTTLTAKNHGTRVLASHNVEEDAIVPILPYLRQEIIRALAEGAEDAIMNGDTAGSHEDTDISSATDRRKLWLGLRAMSNDNGYKTDLGAEFSLTKLRQMRKNMGKYGVVPGRLALITGIAGYIKLLSLAEVVTVDKYGSNATVLSGELAKIDGIPIVVSEWVREVLDSTGIYNAAGTKTVMHLVHRNGFVVGERREVVVRLLTELYAESDQDALLSIERVTFDPLYPIATNRICEMGYNFA